jgi:hypothetical protein
MNDVTEAFRRAFRTAKVLSFEEAVGPVAKLPSQVVAMHPGPWEEQLVAQALIVLRRRGAPEPSHGSNVVFESLVKALSSCEEIPADEHPIPETGRKPAT